VIASIWCLPMYFIASAIVAAWSKDMGDGNVIISALTTPHTYTIMVAIAMLRVPSIFARVWLSNGAADETCLSREMFHQSVCLLI
jgi:hypothetical protein